MKKSFKHVAPKAVEGKRASRRSYRVRRSVRSDIQALFWSWSWPKQALAAAQEARSWASSWSWESWNRRWR